MTPCAVACYLGSAAPIAMSTRTALIYGGGLCIVALLAFGGTVLIIAGGRYFDRAGDRVDEAVEDAAEKLSTRPAVARSAAPPPLGRAPSHTPAPLRRRSDTATPARRQGSSPTRRERVRTPTPPGAPDGLSPTGARTRSGRPSYAPPITPIGAQERDASAPRAKDWGGHLLDAVGLQDAAFSRSGLLDFIIVLHRRVVEAAMSNDWTRLDALVGPKTRQNETTSFGGMKDLSFLAVGDIRVVASDETHQRTQIKVRIRAIAHFSSRVGEDSRQTEEEWSLTRSTIVTSLDPEDALDLVCPACGEDASIDGDGRCRACGAPVAWGESQWFAEKADVFPSRPIDMPPLEPPMVPAPSPPDLAAAERTVRTHHPGLDLARFLGWASERYAAICQGWMSEEWQGVRPHVTDLTLNQMMFVTAAHDAHSLSVQCNGVHVDDARVVEIHSGPIYLTLTVRFRSRWECEVRDAEHTSVGGSMVGARAAERWDFRRRHNPDLNPHDASRCPSCGANSTGIDMMGFCGSCEQWVAMGRFGWVVSMLRDRP